MKCSIGALGFNSKKECLNFVRHRLQRAMDTRIDKSNKDFQFFMDLFKNHPEYEEKNKDGVKCFIIQLNPMDRKGCQLCIEYLDNTIEAVSWVYCVNKNKYSYNMDLTMAMRHAVSKLTMDFKRRSNLICAICKDQSAAHIDYHVDHKTIAFSKLRDNFLEENKINKPILFGKHSTYNFPIFLDDDKAFRKAWKAYHNEHCDFQILCRSCNIKKSNN